MLLFNFAVEIYLFEGNSSELHDSNKQLARARASVPGVTCDLVIWGAFGGRRVIHHNINTT
jgi:hypothetical protein